MSPARAACLAATALAVAAGGCGFGAGDEGDGEATLRVTRDYGTELLAEASVANPSESETVIRLLDREADLETLYGGGFVKSIDGIGGGVEGGRSVDWFFYVNGVESPTGAAEVPVRAGDRIWWDHRDWTDAMRVPAVVGSWPEPFAQASAAAPDPVVLECEAPGAVCDDAAEGLAAEGVDVGEADGRSGSPAGRALRMVVGEWELIRDDEAARLLAGGPQESGVFAGFEADGDGWSLTALDEAAEPAATLGAGAGLVAAVRHDDGPPVFLVTGADEAGVAAAVKLLDPTALRDRYAVASDAGEPLALPVVEAG